MFFMENRWLNKPTAGSALTMKHLVEDKELGVGGGGGTESCRERGPRVQKNQVQTPTLLLTDEVTLGQ